MSNWTEYGAITGGWRQVLMATGALRGYIRPMLHRLFGGRSKPTAQAAARRAVVPEGCRLYVIGDVHGRLDLLTALHARIASGPRAAQHRPPPVKFPRHQRRHGQQEQGHDSGHLRIVQLSQPLQGAHAPHQEKGPHHGQHRDQHYRRATQHRKGLTHRASLLTRAPHVRNRFAGVSPRPAIYRSSSAHTTQAPPLSRTANLGAAKAESLPPRLWCPLRPGIVCPPCPA